MAYAPPIVQLQVLADGVLIDSPTFATTGHTTADMGWELHKYMIKTTDSSTRIEFRSLIDGSC